MTAPAASAPYIPPRPKGEIAKRVLVYVLLALISALFFVPFLWSVSTSFKTLPDSANFSLLPHHWVTGAWKNVWTTDHFAQPRTQLPRGLRVRPSQIPRQGVLLPPRARDADDSRPASSDPGVRDVD